MNIIFKPCDPLSNKKKTYLYFHHEQTAALSPPAEKALPFPCIGRKSRLSLKIRKIMLNIKL